MGKHKKIKGLPRGKHRYMVTLTRKNADELKKLLRQLGLPASTFSSLIDDNLLCNVLPVFRLMHEKQQAGQDLTQADVFTLIGSALQRQMILEGGQDPDDPDNPR